jgi:hypothetical protein
LDENIWSSMQLPGELGFRQIAASYQDEEKRFRIKIQTKKG